MASSRANFTFTVGLCPQKNMQQCRSGTQNRQERTRSTSALDTQSAPQVASNPPDHISLYITQGTETSYQGHRKTRLTFGLYLRTRNDRFQVTAALLTSQVLTSHWHQLFANRFQRASTATRTGISTGQVRKCWHKLSLSQLLRHNYITMLLFITLMQGIYTYMPETNNVHMEYSVAAIL